MCPKGRHPLFCFISFIGIYYPLTDIVIVHIVYNPSVHPSHHHTIHQDRAAVLVTTRSSTGSSRSERKRDLKSDCGAAQARARAGNWRPHCQVQNHSRGRHPAGGSHGHSDAGVAETAEQCARTGKDWEQGLQGIPGASVGSSRPRSTTGDGEMVTPS
jgi:hypothetical protein